MNLHLDSLTKSIDTLERSVKTARCGTMDGLPCTHATKLPTPRMKQLGCT